MKNVTKSVTKLLLVSVLGIGGLPVFSEVIHDVRPFDKLGEIKERYPNAFFVKVNAAWVTADQAFFKMTGQGFPGTLYIALSDSRPSNKRYLSENCNPPAAANERTCEMQRTWAFEPDNEALSTKWVRWVPENPIPLQRYISKYGEPTKIDFENDTLVPFAYWEKNELTASLTDDKKMVTMVSSSFTRAEQREAWQRRAGFIPDYLKDQEAQPPEKPTNKPKAIQQKAL
jgi:hypothetical protein